MGISGLLDDSISVPWLEAFSDNQGENGLISRTDSDVGTAEDEINLSSRK